MEDSRLNNALSVVIVTLKDFHIMYNTMQKHLVKYNKKYKINYIHEIKLFLSKAEH